MNDSHTDNKAYTPWSELCLDLLLLTLALVVPIVSVIIDLGTARPESFQRSGSVMVLFAGLLGYRGLTKHYQKFFNNMQRGYGDKAF